MPTKEELDDLKARNPAARWLDDRAKIAMAEALASSKPTTIKLEPSVIKSNPFLARPAPRTTGISNPNPHHTVNELVSKLLKPPVSAFYLGTGSKNKHQGTVRITSTWVVRTVGKSHFKRKEGNGRPILKDDSKLKAHARAAGLPQGYYNWLVGDGEEGRDAKDKQDGEFTYHLSETQLFEAQDNLPNRSAKY